MALMLSKKKSGGTLTKTTINVTTATSPQTFNVNNGVLVLEYTSDPIYIVSFVDGVQQTPDKDWQYASERAYYSDGVLTITTPNQTYTGWLYVMD